MESSLIASGEMAEKEVESRVKALEEKVRRSEAEVVELKSQRREAESRLQNETESRFRILEAKLESLAIEVEMERAKCRELEGEISRLQFQIQYPKAAIRNAHNRVKQKLKRGTQLPMELMVQILSWLPAESLLRCRSVCKSWLSLISSTQFKFMHLHNSNQLNPRSLCRSFREEAEWGEDYEVYTVHFDDEALTVDHGTVIEFPLKSIYSPSICCRIVGVCNGVLCLSNVGVNYKDYKITLWNPSIRRKLVLLDPLFIPPSNEVWCLAFGFGYDRISEDYKVVRLAFEMIRLSEGELSYTRPRVEVYTMNTSIWRAITFPHDLHSFMVIHEDWSQVFFNGFVHWITLADTGSHKSNVTFDISSEVFGEIQLPEFSTNGGLVVVAVVEECLAVIYSYRNNLVGHCLIWVMDEYQNPASWRLIYNRDTPHLNMRKALRSGDFMIHDHDLSFYVYPDYDDSDNQTFVYVDKYQESLGLLEHSE